MSFSLQCNKIIDNYLLNKNIIFKNRNILSLIVALACAEYIKLTKVNLINKFIVPICLYIVCMLLLHVLITLVISNKERKMLKEKCMLWINDPENKEKVTEKAVMILNLDEIKNYVKTRETFDNSDDKDNSVDSTITDIPTTVKSNLTALQQKIQNDLLHKLAPPDKITYSNLPNPPVPGPQWIPDSAEKVQNRLNTGMYVQSLCSFN